MNENNNLRLIKIIKDNTVNSTVKTAAIIAATTWKVQKPKKNVIAAKTIDNDKNNAALFFLRGSPNVGLSKSAATNSPVNAESTTKIHPAQNREQTHITPYNARAANG